jgi:hypothetical protein
MASSSLPKVLVLGHSFVRRLHDFASSGSEGTSADFGFPASCEVFFRGRGGRLVHHLWAELDAISDIAPEIVILDIGTNDLSSSTAPPGEIAYSVFFFAQHLVEQCAVKAIHIAQVFRRLPDSARTPHNFNELVFTYNDALRSLCRHGHTRSSPLPIFMFFFKGMSSDWASYLDQHGIHFNVLPAPGFSHSGSYKYYRAIKSSIHFALGMSSK